MPIPHKVGRPKKPIEEEIKIVIETYDNKPFGIVRLAKYLCIYGKQLSYNDVEKIMNVEGLVTPVLARKNIENGFDIKENILMPCGTLTGT